MKRIGLGLMASLSAMVLDEKHYATVPSFIAPINYSRNAKSKPNTVSQAKRRKYARQGRK